MSKKPMYLKRRGGSKVFWVSALLALLLIAVWCNRPKPAVQPEPVVEERQEIISESVFKGRVEEIVSPKFGIKAYYMFQKSGLTSVSFTFIQSGKAYENPEQAGVANIVAQTLKEGAGWWSAKELRNLMGSSGIKIGFSVSKDDFSGQVTFPNEQKENAVKYLREMLLNPHFEDRYVETAKAGAIRAIETQKENPSTELLLEFNQAIYGDFAYGRNPIGDIETIKKINRRVLVNFVRNNLAKNRLFVGIVGNIQKEAAEEMLDNLFGKLPILESREIGVPYINWHRPDVNIERNIPQNIVVYAAKGTCRKCEDFYPLYIANYILGGAGLNSRFNQRMREKENLTYGVSSWLDLNDNANILTASFSATGDKSERAEKLFEEIWQEAGEKGFTEDELQNAKDYLISSHNLRFASTSGIAEMLAYMQKYDLGVNFLNQRNQLVKDVTLRQLNQAAKDYFDSNFIKGKIGNINK